MTAEIPPPEPLDIFNYISSDPKIRLLLDSFEAKVEQDPQVQILQPEQPKIEEVALEAWCTLEDLEAGFSEEELNKEPGDDILANLNNNHSFITDYLIYPVFDLMQRTSQPVTLTDFESIGYMYLESENEEGRALEQGIVFTVKDPDDNERAFVSVPDDFERLWDSGPREIRTDLQIFASLTRKEIIDRFYDYVHYYIEP